MSNEKIRSALAEAFLGQSFFAPDRVSWENKKFEPGEEPWAAFFFLPAARTVSTLGQGGSDRITGLVQIDVCYPQNTGTKDAGSKADAVENFFTAGKRFVFSGQPVVISSCGRSQGRISNGYYKISLNVYFYAYVNR